MAENSGKLRIALGADHAGFHAKEAIKWHLVSAGYECDDVGTASEEPVDYPDYAFAAANRVAAAQDRFAILFCGTGMGMAIAANKIPGIRAAVVPDAELARLAREKNDANVLVLGMKFTSEAQALEIVGEFLATPFAGGRHKRRVDKINEMDCKRGR